MKFCTSFALLAAATAGLHLVQAAGSFDNLMSLLVELEEEALTLRTEYEGKDAEISTLISQLTTCEEGSSSSSSSSSSSDEDDEPQPEPTPTPTSGPDATPAPTLIPVVTQGEDLPVPSGGNFTFGRGQSWNYNLAAPVNTTVDVDVVFIDMDAGQTVIDELHQNGKVVVCYFSIGAIENWREDADDFPSMSYGRGTGVSGETFMDITVDGVREIMAGRVEKAANLSCDAVGPGHMMNYDEEDVAGTGFSTSEEEQIEYNSWFADEVHAHGMSVGLTNAIVLVPVIVSSFDFALNEECNEWDECWVYEETFLAQGKPVFNVEYNLNTSVCQDTNDLGLDTILKDDAYDLSAPFCSCVDPSRSLDCMY